MSDTEQTLAEWCQWLRNDLAYRAPELWPPAVMAWLDSTEKRFGERTAPFEVPEWEPGRWWRTVDADGDLWAESSNEREVRRSLDDAPGMTLYRLYERREREWRQET